MAKNAARNIWNKPELRRIGEIKDVAGSQTGGPQASPAKS